MKKKITEIRETAKNGLRNWCDTLSPEKRTKTVVTALVIFAFIALYMAFISFFSPGYHPGLDIKHMKELELEMKELIREYKVESDSINNLNSYPYENGTEHE